MRTTTAWLALPLALAACSPPPASDSASPTSEALLSPQSATLPLPPPQLRNTSCATKVQYNNGTVLQQPSVQIIYWGSSWPTLERKSLPDYLDAYWQDTLSDPDFYDPLQEYSAGGQTIGIGHWAGSVRVTSNPSTAHLADSDIAAFLWNEKQSSAIQQPATNNFYIVVLGEGYTSTNDVDYTTTPPTQKFVGHHGWWKYSDGERVAFAVVPWDQVTMYCNRNSHPELERKVLDNIVAHETREGITDPYYDGWYLPGTNESEIGDYCDDPINDTYLPINGTPMLGVWSQQQCACVGPTSWPSVGGWVQGGWDGTTITMLPTSGSYAIANDVNRGNQIELLAIGGDHNLYWKAQDYAWDGNQWWITGTPGWISKVAAVGTKTGIQVFGVGGNGQIYYQWQNVNGNWSGWTSVSSFTATDLAVQAAGSGAAELFAIDGNGNVQTATLTEPSSGSPVVSGWSSLAMPVAAKQLSLTKVGNFGQLGVLGVDNNIYFNAQTAFYNPIIRRSYWSWTGWQNLGAPYAATATQVVMTHTPSQDSGTRPVAIVLADGRVYRDVLDGTWSGWLSEPFFQQIPDLQQIAVANNADGGVGQGRIEIFALNSRGTVLHLWESYATNDYQWNSNLVRGGQITQLGAGLNGDGRIEIFGVDENTHEIRHDWQNFTASGITWQY